MLPIVLVLFVASSAFAAPSVQVTQYSINDVTPAADNGRLVSSYLTDRAFEHVDGGDTNIYILTLQQILNDLANQPDSVSQAIALSQTIAVLGELSTGIPGDSCEAAALIDAYAFAVGSGNYAGVRSALARYISRQNLNVDLIVQLSNNPRGVRLSAGPRGNCNGSGRQYQFEAAWDAVLSSANVSQIGLLNEEYCAAKRLYSAFNIRSNNVGAAVTAASLGPVTQVFERAFGPVANFLRSVAAGANPSQAAGAAKAALSNAARNVSF